MSFNEINSKYARRIEAVFPTKTRTPRQPFPRIYFYDKTMDVVVYGAVVSESKSGGLMVLDTQGFIHAVTRTSEDESCGFTYVTCNSTSYKRSAGYSPYIASQYPTTALLDRIDMHRR